jgi:murein DD-endopeptidase MepM/ murein hydrolase activator NlpD
MQAARGFTLALAGLVVTTANAPTAFAKTPWVARKPPVEPKPTHQLLDPKNRWPAEPEAPAVVDPERFKEAVAHLCADHRVSAEKAAPLAQALLDAGKAEQVDPFMLAALAHTQSRCNPSLTSPGGFGLFRLAKEMYTSEGAPESPVSKEAFLRASLLNPVTASRTAAALLRMWNEKHEGIDALFEGHGVPHRSGVAHFLWGDIVRNSGNEDQVFTARRRLIRRYVGDVEQPLLTSLGLPFYSPLEGAPRVASSGPGEDRDGGARQHKGLDIAAIEGEPIRAVADGEVIFAGFNFVGHPRSVVPADKMRRYIYRAMGPGGAYVCIQHDRDREIVTCYMHVSAYYVNEHDTVEAGQVIGLVGVTGVKQSAPHLHFEVREGNHIVNPAKVLATMVIPPKATVTYQYVMAKKRAKKHRRNNV